MRFYYFSLFSWMVYGVAVFIATVLLWLVWTKLLRLKVGNPLYWALIAAIVIAPWGEELWIAYSFGRLCRKDAGMFVYKTVKVDGFYDSTMPSAYDLTRKGLYKFVEQPAENGRGAARVELASDAEREKALAWYAEHNPGKERPSHRSIFYPLSGNQVIAVFPNGVDAWRVTSLAKPTARYRYVRTRNHTRVAHRVSEIEYVVLDSETKNILGRYTNYYRGPYWFFIHLDAPMMPCAETEAAMRRARTMSMFALVLKPRPAK